MLLFTICWQLLNDVTLSEFSEILTNSFHYMSCRSKDLVSLLFFSLKFCIEIEKLGLLLYSWTDSIKPRQKNHFLPIKLQYQHLNKGQLSSNPYAGLGRPLGLQDVEVSRISRHSAHEGGKIVSPKHRPHLPPRRYTWYSFMSRTESISGLQCGKIMSFKNSSDLIGKFKPRPSGL